MKDVPWNQRAERFILSLGDKVIQVSLSGMGLVGIPGLPRREGWSRTEQEKLPRAAGTWGLRNNILSIDVAIPK